MTAGPTPKMVVHKIRHNEKRVKDAQAQMRHARPGITLEIYQQFVPESQKRVVDNLGRLAHFGQFALNLPKPAGSA